MHDPSYFAGVEPLAISGVIEPLTSIEILPFGGQTTEPIFEESPDAPDEAMDIEWPTVAALRPRFIMGSAADLLGQLEDLLSMRPIPSWLEGREFLLLATLSYHAMGFAKEPWIVALECVWAEFTTLQH